MHITPEQIQWILIDIIVLVISIGMHEFGHAFMADRLGDDTPRRQGRVTLNPIAHASLIGTILLPLFGGIHAAAGGKGGGFGWGKPVQWNPARIRRGIKMSTAKILVSLAGPFMNLVLAITVSGVHSILIWRNALPGDSKMHAILFYAVVTNFVLMFFNLLPIPPLDGGHVAEQFMPYKHRAKWDEVSRYGIFIVFAIASIPQLAQVFVRPAMWCTGHLYQLFGAM